MRFIISGKVPGFLEDDPDYTATSFNREEREARLPPLEKEMQDMMGQIFMEELQKAINEEIIATIKK